MFGINSNVILKVSFSCAHKDVIEQEMLQKKWFD